MSRSDIRKFFGRLGNDQRGVSAMEFAFILPVLVLMAVGTADFGRLLLLTHKLQNGAFILADLSGRDQTLNAAQLDNIFLALEDLVEPFEFGAGGTAVISSVSGEAGGSSTVNWQRFGAGTLEIASAVGVEDGYATLPGSFSLVEGETIIVAEIAFNYVPMFGIGTSAHTIRKTAYIKPRLGTLETLQP